MIIPAAGKSSRYNAGKPKWMRTHPNGELMIEHSINSFLKTDDINVNIFLITLKEIDNEFKVLETLSSSNIVFKEIILLENATSSPVETIYKGIKNSKYINLALPSLFKDSDNFVEIEFNKNVLKNNFTVGCDLNVFDVSNIKNKSFLIYNDLNKVTDFIEKSVVSDTISVGTHFILNTIEFIYNIEKLLKLNIDEELYLSHVIANMILENVQFDVVLASNYIDFGTQNEWDNIFKKHTTYFLDFDGTLVYNKGKYGENNWFEKNDKPLTNNLRLVSELQKNGGTIIITTSRCSSLKEYIADFLKGHDIIPKDIICDLNHSPRTIINDFANTNPYPSCEAINIPRNEDLTKFFNYGK